MQASMHRLADLFERLMAPILERANPILVKEVRQSLRGRLFSILFWLTLCAGTGIAVLFLVFVVGDDAPADSGAWFFVWMYGCLSLAVHLFVPFSAFLSLGSEWEENTHDLLVLSNLRPRQIIIGKLLSAGVQAILYFSAFGPFLVFAFLLPGIDLKAGFWILGLSVLTSLALSTLAVSLSSLTRIKHVRVVLWVILAAVLVPASIGAIGVASQLVLFPFFFSGREYLIVFGIFVTILLVVSAYAFLLACARLAHPEENRSSGLRALTAAAVLAYLGWVSYGMSIGPDEEALMYTGFIVLGFVGVVSTFFCSEPDRLGRRVGLHVPANPVLAGLATPFLPGGGRGLLFLLLQATVVYVGAVLIWEYQTPVGGVWGVGGSGAPGAALTLGGLLTAPLYTLIYLGLLTLIVGKRLEFLSWRILVRVAVPLLAFLGFLVPTVLGFLFEIDDLKDGEHLGNPFWLLTRFERNNGGEYMGWFQVLAGCAAVVGILNLPRIVHGVREVQEMSAKRRARSAPDAGGAGAPAQP